MTPAGVVCAVLRSLRARKCVVAGAILLTVASVSAVAQTDAHITPTALAFPVVSLDSTSTAQTVVLNNYSSSALPVTSVSVTGQFTADSSNCGNSVAGGEQCYIYVKAAPTAAGAFTGTLTVMSGGTAFSVALSGTTVPANTTTTTLTSSGSAGAYTLTATVAGAAGAGYPSGTLSLVDTSNTNFSLGAPTLVPGSSTFGLSTYSPPPVGVEPVAIATGDFNGDGKLDIVVENGGPIGCSYSNCPNSFSLLLGNGDGTFTVSTISTPTYSYPDSSMVVGDFNGDGKLDIAATNTPDGHVILLLGNGDGTFTATETASIGYVYAAADVNGDGKLDIVVGNFTNPSSLSVLLGNGNGTFSTTAAVNVDSSIFSLAVGDFNGDGKLDVAVACFGQNGNYSQVPSSIDILLGSGTGQFTHGTTIHTSAFGADTLSHTFAGLAAGDLNGDSKTDLVAYVSNENYPATPMLIVPLLGSGNGTFTAQTPIQTTDSNYEATVALGDFNGDGKLDISLADDTNFSVMLGNGDGSFQAPVSVPGAVTDPSYLTQAVGDFNGDGLADMAVANGDLNIVQVELSTRTETSTATLSNVSVPGPGSHNVTASYPGDSKFAASTSDAIPLTGSSIATNLTVTATPSSSLSGAQVVLQASLTPYATGGLKTGGEQITFYSGGVALGTGTLSTGVATLNTTSLPVGTDNITATYAGDSNYLESSAAAVPVTVTVPVPAVSLSASSLTFSTQTAGVASSPQTVTVTNSGTAPLVISGAAASGDFSQTNTCTTVAVGGTCTIAVTFTPTVSGSRTGTITLTDNAASSPQTITLTGTGAPVALSPNTTSLTITSPGATTTTTVSITPAPGFSGAVTLGCTVAYAGTGTGTSTPSCTLNPASVTLTAGTASSTTLTVSTTAASGALRQPELPGERRGAEVAVAGLVFVCVVPVRRRMRGTLLMLVALIAVGAATGCGGSGSSTPSTPGTTTGNYTVTVSAMANSITTSTKLTLNVQ